MPCVSQLSPDKKILETKLDGLCSPEEIFTSVKYAIGVQKEEGTKLFLVDCTTFIPKDKNAIFNAYDLVKLFDELEVDRRSKDALIVPNGSNLIENLEFFELASTNRGYQIKIFHNRESALNWLQE